MAIGVFNLVCVASLGVVSKAGYVYHLQDVNLSEYEDEGMGKVTKQGDVFWGPDRLQATGQRWPNGE